MRVAIYARISDDRDGKAKNVQIQIEECLKLVTREGYQVVPDPSPTPDPSFDAKGAFWDNSFSAHSGVERPAWERLKSLLGNNQLDGIVCWNTDRLYRRMSELVKLGELVKGDKLKIFAVTSGPLDLSSADGNFVANILTAVSQKESDTKSERIALKKYHQAKAGEWNGGRAPLGYRARPLDGSGSKLGLEIDPIKGPALRKAALRYIGGESLTVVMNDFREETGSITQYTSFKNALLTPSISGQRSHIPRTVRGNRTQQQILTEPWFIENNAALHTAVWSPLITIDQWEALRYRMVNSKENKRGKQPSKSLLAGLVLCGACGGGMANDGEGTSPGSGKKRYANYRCNRSNPIRWRRGVAACGGVRVGAQSLDDFVTDAFFRQIREYTRKKRFRTVEMNTSEILTLENDRTKLTKRMDGYNEMRADGDLTLEEHRKYRTQIDSEVQRITEEIHALRSNNLFGRQMLTAEEVWATLSVNERRERIKLLIRSVLIVKAEKLGHSNTLNPDRVKWIEWSEAAEQRKAEMVAANQLTR